MSNKVYNNQQSPQRHMKPVSKKMKIYKLLDHLRWVVITTKSKNDILTPLDMLLQVWYDNKGRGGDMSLKTWQQQMAKVFTAINKELLDNRLQDNTISDLSKLFNNPPAFYCWYIQAFDVTDVRPDIEVTKYNVKSVVGSWNEQSNINLK